MAKPVTLKAGQFLLLVFAVLMIGAGAGALVVGLLWRVRGYVNVSAPAEIVGLMAFVVVAIWKSCDDWAARTGDAKPS